MLPLAVLEEDASGAIEIDPALGIGPTGLHLRNVEQSVSFTACSLRTGRQCWLLENSSSAACPGVQCLPVQMLSMRTFPECIVIFPARQTYAGALQATGTPFPSTISERRTT